ncbi:response regulator [Arcticibacter eurypsychrophilus]|uniref:response regulator n=1 Tax=Arcticibacter eurypsychrophilus TaxID=1434752 RepID=UPI00084CFCC6|nr:response regulator [Arcticibacter eurypsychrophilus]
MNSELPLTGKILVVEDNEINRFLVNKLLSTWGIHVEFAENGQVAVEKVTSRPYDVVLMDVHMPVMDGFEAARTIRCYNKGQFKSLPIIALTASVMQNDLDEIMLSGMNGYIIKPFVQAELRLKISDLLNNAALNKN